MKRNCEFAHMTLGKASLSHDLYDQPLLFSVIILIIITIFVIITCEFAHITLGNAVRRRIDAGA